MDVACVLGGIHGGKTCDIDKVGAETIFEFARVIIFNNLPCEYSFIMDSLYGGRVTPVYESSGPLDMKLSLVSIARCE